MATFIDKYTGDIVSADGKTYTLIIREDAIHGFTGAANKVFYIKDSLQIVTGQEGIDLYKPIRNSTLSVGILDDDGAIETDLNQRDEERFRVELKNGTTILYVGKFIGNIGRFSRNKITKEPLQITAIDSLAQLEEIDYTNKVTGAKLTGLSSLVAIVADILSRTDLQLNFNTGFNWYTPNNAGTGTDPFSEGNLDREVFRNVDIERNIDEPVTCDFVLRQILTGCGLTLVQSRGEWRLTQPTSKRAGTFENFQYDKDGTLLGFTNVDPEITIPVGKDDFAVRLEGTEGTEEEPILSTAITYVHGDIGRDIIVNGSFERFTGNVPDNYTLGNASAIRATNDAHAFGRKALEMDAIPNEFNLPITDPSLFITFADQVGREVAGNVGSVMDFNVFAKIDFSTTQITNFDGRPVHVEFGIEETGGTRHYWDNAGQAFTTTQTRNRIDVILKTWNHIQFRTTEIVNTGKVFFRLYTVIENKQVTTTLGTINEVSLVRWDDVKIDILSPSETEEGATALKTSVVLTGSNNKVNRELSDSLWGTGPSFAHKGAFKTSAGLLLDNFQEVPFVSGPSGKSIHKLLVETQQKQFATPAQIFEDIFIISTRTGMDMIFPDNVVNIGGSRYEPAFHKWEVQQGDITGRFIKLQSTAISSDFKLLETKGSEFLPESSGSGVAETIFSLKKEVENIAIRHSLTTTSEAISSDGINPITSFKIVPVSEVLFEAGKNYKIIDPIRPQEYVFSLSSPYVAGSDTLNINALVLPGPIQSPAGIYPSVDEVTSSLIQTEKRLTSTIRGDNIATLSASVAAGIAITSIPIDFLEFELGDNEEIFLKNGSGQTDGFIVNSVTAVGATSITVDPKAPTNAYIAGDDVLLDSGAGMVSQINQTAQVITLSIGKLDDKVTNKDEIVSDINASAGGGTINDNRIDSGITRDSSVIASINLSSEGVRIQGDNIAIDGNTTFTAGLDPAENAVIIRQTTAPTVRPDGSALKTGDIWVDTDDGDRPYSWNGTTFIQQMTSIIGGNLQTGSVTAGKLSVTSLDAITATMGNLTVNNTLDITTGQITAGEVILDSSGLRTSGGLGITTEIDDSSLTVTRLGDSLELTGDELLLKDVTGNDTVSIKKNTVQIDDASANRLALLPSRITLNAPFPAPVVFDATISPAKVTIGVPLSVTDTSSLALDVDGGTRIAGILTANGTIFLGNTTEPAAPTNGVFLYSEGGVLKAKTATGITTLAS